VFASRNRSTVDVTGGPVSVPPEMPAARCRPPIGYGKSETDAVPAEMSLLSIDAACASYAAWVFGYAVPAGWTTIVPAISGTWTLHQYLYVPGFGKVSEYVAPPATKPELV